MRPRRQSDAWHRTPARTLVALLVLGFATVTASGIAAERPTPRGEVPSGLSRTAIITGVDRAHLRTALQAVRKSRWRTANSAIQQAEHPLARKVVHWLYLTTEGNGPGYAETRAFLVDNPDWPLRHTLQTQLERRIPSDAPALDLVEFFAEYPPLTGIGHVRHAQALQRIGRDSEAEQVIRRAWTEYGLPAAVEREVLTQFKSVLGPVEHERRLDQMLWDRQWGPATRQLKRVPQDLRHLGEARIRLTRRWDGVDQAIARVPEHLLNHPGLVFDRVRWRRGSGYFDSTYEILKAPPTELVEPSDWWHQRRFIGRWMINDHQFEKAYELMTPYEQYARPERAESAWVAGWLALEFLDKPEEALRHFRVMRATVSFPISVARAEYWSSRAARRLGQTDAAEKYALAAAAYPETYYGQAAGRLLRTPIALPDLPTPTATDSERFKQLELVRIVKMLGSIGAEDFVRRFTNHLADTARSDAELVLLHSLCLDLGMPHLAIRVAKRGIRQGRSMPRLLFPLPDRIGFPPDAVDDRVPYALALAVANQESAFQPDAESPAGARGLMQLMPATAKATARRLRVKYSEMRLVGDHEYNVQLGSWVLASLLDRYNGSLPLALAGYNAGTGRVRDWIRTHGDPRTDEVSLANWLELIPVRETRNYVQRVMEGYRVYDYLLSNGRTLRSSN